MLVHEGLARGGALVETPVPAPRVVFLLGTDHHPFDRLVGWAAALAESTNGSCFVQHGYTSLLPGLEGQEMLGGRELAHLMESADAVVTHGGPGLIMEARAAGHLPIVVPRNPALGEHVDGHQMAFTARLGAAGTIDLVDSLEGLQTAVEAAVRRGRSAMATSGEQAQTLLRFATLMDELVYHGRPATGRHARRQRRNGGRGTP